MQTSNLHVHVPALLVCKRQADKDDFVQLQGSSVENQPLHVNCLGIRFGKWFEVASSLVLLNVSPLRTASSDVIVFPIIYTARLTYLLLFFNIEQQNYFGISASV